MTLSPQNAAFKAELDSVLVTFMGEPNTLETWRQIADACEPIVHKYRGPYRVDVMQLTLEGGAVRFALGVNGQPLTTFR